MSLAKRQCPGAVASGAEARSTTPIVALRLCPLPTSRASRLPSGSASPFDAPADHTTFSASPIDPAAFELRKPVIAALNGHAIGMGLTIALQADVRIVADDAKYGVVQVRRGVIPDCMSHWTLAHLTNLGVAAEVLLTGRTFNGAEAVAFGIANKALPAAQVLDHALEMARDIATNVAPMSAALCKRLLWDTAINGYTPRRVAALETQLHHRVMGSDDAREGVSAFLEGRPPRFSLRLSADWTPLPAHRLGAVLNWVSSQSPDFDNACKMPGYVTADLRYAYRYSFAEFALGVQNAGDRKYYTQAFSCISGQTSSIYPEAGRAFVASVRDGPA